LDGVRAIAVALVVGYHAGIPWLGGGLLGVSVFFTLSGYLITAILLSGWEQTRGVGLGMFWIRRARRLLPAVVVLLLVVMAATVVVDPGSAAARGREALAALFYVANWTTIASGQSYFDRVAGPGPLDHMWSLAVEEQFYLVWPLVLLGLIVLLGGLRRVAWATALLAAGSFVLLAVLAQPGFDNTRAYEATDTRAGSLLVGAAVALIWRPGRLPLHPGRPALARWDAAGVLALMVIGALAVGTDQYSMFLYHGGLLVLSLATAALVLVVSHPASRLGRVLGVGPLAWLGERSYGIYLWHLPVLVFAPAALLRGQPLLRGILLGAVSVGLAALSWRWLEEPIRRYGLLGALRREREQVGRRLAVPALVTGTGALALVGTLTLSAAAQVTPGSSQAIGRGPVNIDKPPIPPDATQRPVRDTPEPSPSPSAPAAGAPSASPAPGATTTLTSPPTSEDVLRTSCTQLVHVGDSTSVGLVDPAFQPVRKARLPAQYKRIGITDFEADIFGGRSIVETYKGQPNAQQAVTSRLAAGYTGCWVIAMGINEAANQYVGGTYPFDRRIDLLMQPIGEHPVLWMTVRTLRSSGPYQDAQMQKWNQALLTACSRYPTMRVYDWRAESKTAWFVDDGIHFTAKGYRERAARIADAFARAFPASGELPAGCVVGSGR
jgi:peptidoglycan/LPS O-acetylase OafA/YrhL